MASNNPNNNTSKTKSLFYKAGRYLLGYFLFTVILAALFFLLWRIRADVIIMAYQLDYNIVQVTGISNYTIVIAGILMLVGVGYSEDRLRKAIEENRMWKPIRRIFVATAALWGIWVAIYYVAMWIILS